MTTTMSLDIGISPESRHDITDALCRLLADTYTLYLKTHHFHWNVKGPMFATLHQMFETEYVELWEAVDAIAERIRKLGHDAPGTYRDFARLTTVPETVGIPLAMDMVRELVTGHEVVIRTARSLVPLAERALDEATVELVTQRLEAHEKTAWMLRTLLEE